MSRKYKSKDWMLYEEAEAFVRGLGLNSEDEWKAYCKSGNKPKNIPKSPWALYPQWNGMRQWLGTGHARRAFLPFDVARDFVRKMRLKSLKEWTTYSKSGRRPRNIPSNPNGIYKHSGWKSIHDWLGVTPSPIMDFEEARAFVRKLGLKSITEWNAYCRSGKKPKHIPSGPNDAIAYKGHWRGFRDWLGTTQYSVMPYEDVKRIVSDKGLLTSMDYAAWRKMSNIHGLPSHPHRSYKNSGWNGWTEFLGNGRWMSIGDAKKFVHTLGFTMMKEWNEYCKGEGGPSNIPSRPDKTYKNQGWVSWRDWLDCERWPFEQAREFARAMNFSGRKAWREYMSSDARSRHLPKHPCAAYRDEWVSWGDWFGNENMPVAKRAFREFHAAREFARSLGLSGVEGWLQFCKSGNRPKDIPSNPQITYKDIGWISTADWLGSTNIAAKNRNFIPFDQFISRVKEEQGRGRKLNTEDDYRAWAREPDFPVDMPKSPDRYY